MMGERGVGQDALFYEFSLERHVPADHLLRSIDRFVDLSGVREHLRSFYSETGRPSIDPEVMIRMLIVGYCFGIRSERRLCDEVHLNLAYRWFCRLGLDGAVPDHSTFSKNRHGRFRDSDLLRKVFETTVQRCIGEGLVGGEGFAVDASMIKADANRQRSAPGGEWVAPETASHAVREYLAVLDDAAFGAATPVVPKFISHADPASRCDGSEWRAGLLRLLHQLPDRPEVRRDCRCRGDYCRPPSRGHGTAPDDRSHAGEPRPLARALGGRCRLRFGREPRLAGA
jgi:transposase